MSDMREYLQDIFDKVQEGMEDMRGTIHCIVESVPSEVYDDWEALEDAFGALCDEILGTDGNALVERTMQAQLKEDFANERARRVRQDVRRSVRG